MNLYKYHTEFVSTSYKTININGYIHAHTYGEAYAKARVFYNGRNDIMFINSFIVSPTPCMDEIIETLGG